MNIGKGKGRKNKIKTEKQANHKRLINKKNKLRVDGGWGRGGNTEEGTC